MFKFITQRSFFVNLLVAVALLFLSVFLFFISLGSVTHHGETIRVPQVTGKLLADATSVLEKEGFKVSVQDSVYIDSVAPLAVIKQSPASEELVKLNRTVYLTINRAHPPLIEMPDLRGFSFKSAEMYLQSIGLKIGDTTYTPDIARNAVKDQLYNGSIIEPGTKIPMSSSIDLVLGNGLGDTEIAVPDLIGLTVSQVKEYILNAGIGIGVIIAADVIQDTANAYVIKQNPETTTQLPTGETVPNHIRAGQFMDIWISTIPPVTDSSDAETNHY